MLDLQWQMLSIILIEKKSMEGRVLCFCRLAFSLAQKPAKFFNGEIRNYPDFLNIKPFNASFC